MIAEGLTVVASNADFPETVRRLDTALAEHGVTPVLRLDHAAAAARAELVLEPTLLVVFGDPRVGTPLMQVAPSLAIDLPLKILVWRTRDGGVHVAYNDPEWLAARHGASGGGMLLAGMRKTLASLASAASGGGTAA